ncbi:sprouty-related, EVH1 domain-containing protein 2 [Coccinella septempunctata]|uniref:sprouty-related, EVH1 domain-containing protein 2 n=1 Tax=Coccinella septempunctata TaxID=41139 RepID=UPI001D08B804|nr:sprouty-related, EVH1 domain-containing protein 2 [Coccinella septempunctata]
MIDPCEDGNYLVRVRAQVMSRDDSSGGWVPLGGGGLSNVSVRKRLRPCPATTGEQDAPAPSKQKHEYLIFGKRISDQNVVLSCTIKKDFEYNKVMPTFHHWKTGDKKFGLTFQTAADARAFDKGVRTAVEELLDGFAGSSPPPFSKFPKDVGDDEVFMTLNLPQEPKDSRSSSDSSTKGIDYLHKITYLNVKDKPQPPEPRQPIFEPMKGDKGDNYSYVQLAVHDYNYPILEDQRPRDFEDDLKKRNTELVQPLPILPAKKNAQGRAQMTCKYCNELYFEDGNPRGSCEYGPDCWKSTINKLTCMGCVHCVCYHCAADAEGEFAPQPCACDCVNDESCVRRWICLTFLSIFLPCLWCYPPLKMCHWCGMKLGVCGARHSM